MSNKSPIWCNLALVIRGAETQLRSVSIHGLPRPGDLFEDDCRAFRVTTINWAPALDGSYKATVWASEEGAWTA